jgi:hypothetical protein
MSYCATGHCTLAYKTLLPKRRVLRNTFPRNGPICHTIKTDLRDKGCIGVDLWRALVIAVVSFHVPWDVWRFLSGCTSGGSSGGCRHREVSYFKLKYFFLIRLKVYIYDQLSFYFKFKLHRSQNILLHQNLRSQISYVPKLCHSLFYFIKAEWHHLFLTQSLLLRGAGTA